MEFAANIDNLPKMLSFIKERAAFHGMGEQAIKKLELASEEAVVNIISYAYPHKKEEGKIDILCEKSGSRVEVTFRDKGIPFNPLILKADSEVRKNLHDRKIGGLGIFLIEQLIEEISYRRENGENVLKLSMSLCQSL